MISNSNPAPSAIPAPSFSGGPRGCVFFNFGEAYVVRLLVAIHSLRRVYTGPVSVFLAGESAHSPLVKQLQKLDCDTVLVQHLSKSWDRDLLLRQSPYATTLFCDADLLFRASIDALWEPLETKGLLVTRFSAEPYGVDGTPEKRGWADRVSFLARVRGLLGDTLHDEALRRMLEQRIDVNIGVLGISRPQGDDFVTVFTDRMRQGRSDRALLLDEMLVLGLLPAHDHYLAEERWNCPADAFFRTTSLEDAAVIHYFADGHAVGGTRLGRNPSSPAGRIWFNAATETSSDIDLRPWLASDRTLLAHLTHVQRVGSRDTKDASTEKFAAHVKESINAQAPERLGVSVILLSYRRPQNIDRILFALRQCEFVKEIILSNNNPDLRMSDHVHVRDDRLRIVEQPTRCYPSIRMELSRQARCQYLIAIDDDIFPQPEQLLALYDALRIEPRMPHGFAGEVYDEAAERQTHFVTNRNLPVESLVWIFAYTRDHVRRYFELLAKAGLDNESLRFNEDVPLSFAGDDFARAHYVGPIENCKTSTTVGIASHREDGFEEQRARLIQSMRNLTGRRLVINAPGKEGHNQNSSGVEA